MRAEQQAKGLKPQYDGKCRDLNLEKSENTVLRLKTPLEGTITVKDYVRGEIVFNNSELDDLIILRSDGSPTYHLCNVVDDYEQGVTTVIRGEDHISNTKTNSYSKCFGISRVRIRSSTFSFGQR